MNLFQAVFGPNARSNTTIKANRFHLPEVYSFVDVVAGKAECLPVENIGGTTFDVRRPALAVVGAKALFNYTNNLGRFRFQAECLALDDRIATYGIPADIAVIEKFGHKRQSYRLKYALAVDWRYAPDGVGYGQYSATATADMSCAGVSLVVPRELRVGTEIELKIELSGMAPIVLVGTIARPTQRQPSGKFLAGLAFRNISRTAANAIAEFIAKRQHAQRLRYLADEN